MKVLLCHSYYQQRGGEDQSFDLEAALLAEHGHEVIKYVRHNDEIEHLGKLAITAKTFWNRQTYRDVRALVRQERPDVMHCTNTFPLLSPSIYYAAKAERVPVVQSLRNYRQLCPVAVMTRDGKLCEDCVGKAFAWPGVRHGCYRGSAATAVVAGMSTLHRWIGTWSRAVDLYFTLSEFAKAKFVSEGWDETKIAVKPNFVHPDPGPGSGQGDYAVFVGRLSPEKGISTLLDAWRQLPRAVPLKIIGAGPLESEVRKFTESHSQVEWIGQRSLGELLDLIGEAKFLVMPSVWYETFGRTIIEAFAKGTPVIASNLGAMAELVDDGQTGLLFKAGDASDLADKVTQFLSMEADYDRMRKEARQTYEAGYTAARNHDLLVGIYEQAMSLARGKTTTVPAMLATSR